MKNSITKICSKCNLELSITEYHKSSSSQDGIVNRCKSCRKFEGVEYRKKYDDLLKERKKTYKLNNPNKITETNKKSGKKYKDLNREKIKQSSIIYRENNKEKLKIKSKNYKLNNLNKIKEYNLKNKESIKQYKQEYYVKNKELINKKIILKYHTDPMFKLSHLTRSRILKYLKSKNIIKCTKTFNLIGCTKIELKHHIESLFIDGMSWDNQGKWHIDHIIPLSSVKTEEEIYKLCHYTNLQPLWAEDNLKKSNKLNYTG